MGVAEPQHPWIEQRFRTIHLNFPGRIAYSKGMTRSPCYRSFCSAPVWLAVLVVCLWPAFAVADCCCSRLSESTVTIDSGNEVTASAGCPHCQLNDQEQPDDRITLSDSRVVLDKLCQCELRCCDFEAFFSHQVMISGERHVDPSLDDLGTPIAHLIQPPAGVDLEGTRSIPLRKEVGSSNDRCALLCRWLK